MILGMQKEVPVRTMFYGCLQQLHEYPSYNEICAPSFVWGMSVVSYLFKAELVIGRNCY